MAFDRKAWQKAYRSTEEFKAKRRATRDLVKNREDCKKYYANNYDKISAKHKEYYLKPNVVERVKEQKKFYQQTTGKITKKKYIEELHDTYICNQMCRNSNLQHKDIPKELIEAKRLQLLIRRITDEKRK
jgi:hypothetical protein